MSNAVGIRVEAGLGLLVGFHVVKYVAPVWRRDPGPEAHAAIAEPMYIWWFSKRSWWRYQRSALWIDLTMASVAMGGIARLSLGADTGPQVFDLPFKPLLFGFLTIAGATWIFGRANRLIPLRCVVSATSSDRADRDCATEPRKSPPE